MDKTKEYEKKEMKTLEELEIFLYGIAWGFMITLFILVSSDILGFNTPIPDLVFVLMSLMGVSAISGFLCRLKRGKKLGINKT